METWKNEFFFWKHPELLAEFKRFKLPEDIEEYRKCRDIIRARMEEVNYGTKEALAYKAGFEEGKASNR